MLIGKLKGGRVWHIIYHDFVLGYYGTDCGLEDQPMAEVADVCYHCGEHSDPRVFDEGHPIPKVTCKKCLALIKRYI